MLDTIQEAIQEGGHCICLMIEALYLDLRCSLCSPSLLLMVGIGRMIT